MTQETEEGMLAASPAPERKLLTAPPEWGPSRLERVLPMLLAYAGLRRYCEGEDHVDENPPDEKPPSNGSEFWICGADEADVGFGGTGAGCADNPLEPKFERGNTCH